MADYSKVVCCSKEIHNRLNEDVRGEFLKHHPEMEGVKISKAYLLNHIIEYYLNN